MARRLTCRLGPRGRTVAGIAVGIAGAIALAVALGACGRGAAPPSASGAGGSGVGSGVAVPVEVPSNCPPEPAPTGAPTLTIAIAIFTYCPPNLEVAMGTEVTWTNADLVSHTATTVEGSTHPFDSGDLAQGQSFTVRLDAAGVYEYFCVLHPGMRARIVVA